MSKLPTECRVCGRKDWIHPKGKRRLCVKHYRFIQMIRLAKARKLHTPKIDELEELISGLDKMNCFVCNKEMIWASFGGSRKSVVSLQHDRSGMCRLICLSCNIKHAHMPGDSFYDLPPGSKFCNGCKTIKSVSCFSSDKSVTNGLSGHCKVCALTKTKAWYWKNRDRSLRVSAIRYQRRKYKQHVT